MDIDETREFLIYLKKKIRKIEQYLGPIMNYEDEGYDKIPSLYRPQAAWIYSYYLHLKNMYYENLQILPEVVIEKSKRSKREKKKRKRRSKKKLRKKSG